MAKGNPMSRQIATAPATARRLVVAGAVATLSLAAVLTEARAQGVNADRNQDFTVADPNEAGDGTLGPAARAAIEHGPLPYSAATAAAKAAANRARDEAARSPAPRPFLSPAELAASGQGWAGPSAPVIVGGFNHAGQNAKSSSPTPPDTTGSIGPNSYIQLVNSNIRIVNRTSGAVIGSGTLDQLAGISSSVNSFDPQMMWDAQTNRFYYVMDSIFSATDNRLSFGFSTTANPTNATTDWCHYTFKFGVFFPDYPKLGDSRYFAIVGFNGFNPNFVGAGILAVSKPPAGTTCPAPSALKSGRKLGLVDSGAQLVFTPVPANQIDTVSSGYVVAEDGVPPGSHLWFFNVTKSGAGTPVFGPARGVTVPSYAVPASATQPTFSQTLDTMDTRPTQAVQATDPGLGAFAFYTVQTVSNGTTSDVRWYEIAAAPATPVVLRTGAITSPGIFLFNGSISPDRRVKTGTTSAFGDSFVVQYSASSPTLNPQIVAASSVAGGALSFLTIRTGVAGYVDFSCPNPGDVCRWGDYSGASPDPNTRALSRGVVWGANQFDCVASPSTARANWCTQIFAVEP